MKQIRLSQLIAVLLLSLVVLFGCSDDLLKLSYKDGLLVDNSSNISYNSAPVNVSAVSLGDEYAKLKDGSFEMILHTINDLDPTEYLTENTQGIGAVFINTTIEMPTAENFEANSAILSYEDPNTSAISEISKEEITVIMEKFLSEEEVSYAINSDESYTLSLLSNKYKGLYYNLIYFSKDGNNYLYDRSTKKCVDVGDLLVKYFGTAEVTK